MVNYFSAYHQLSDIKIKVGSLQLQMFPGSFSLPHAYGRKESGNIGGVQTIYFSAAQTERLQSDCRMQSHGCMTPSKDVVNKNYSAQTNKEL